MSPREAPDLTSVELPPLLPDLASLGLAGEFFHVMRP
jgi:hypothetical protein